jgi:ankyrin repeat protein
MSDLTHFLEPDELLYGEDISNGLSDSSDSDSSDSDSSDSDIINENSSDINELRKVLFARKVMRKVERYQFDTILRVHINKFLENGMSINTQDIKGDTILHILFTIYNKIIYDDSEYLEIMTFVKLINHYIEKGADKTIKNQDGLIPLEIARNNETYELLEKFI